MILILTLQEYKGKGTSQMIGAADIVIVDGEVVKNRTGNI